jgi:hypothetical protein
MIDIKKRSPSYPRISLNKAIDLARRVHESAYQSAVDNDTVLTLMGFRGKSGPATAALASLKQYGLIEGRDQALRITPLAIRIFHPSDIQERDGALLDAVFTPQFYDGIRKQFAGKIPADQVLQSYLIRNHGFKNKGAQEFIKILKENRPYMGIVAADFSQTANLTSNASSNENFNQLNTKMPPQFASQTRKESGRQDSEDSEIYRLRVTPDCVVTITYNGRISRRAIDQTISYLGFVKSNFPFEE